MFGCIRSSLLCTGLSLVAASGGHSSPWRTGFSSWWPLLLQSMGSECTGFSSCGAWTQLLHSTWDLPGPGIEPVSPALAGGFLNHCATREVPVLNILHCLYYSLFNPKTFHQCHSFRFQTYTFWGGFLLFFTDFTFHRITVREHYLNDVNPLEFIEAAFVPGFMVIFMNALHIIKSLYFLFVRYKVIYVYVTIHRHLSIF